MWWGHSDVRNGAWALQGPSQTIQRSELSALLHAACWSDERLVVRTDSEWVAGGASLMAANDGPGRNWQHRDLWAKLHRRLKARCGTDTQVDIETVRAHRTKEDVEKGVISEEDREGNEQADRLAKEASSTFCCPSAAIFQVLIAHML